MIRERFNLTGNEGMALEYVGAVTDNVRGGAFLYTNRNSLSLGVIGQVSSLVETQEAPLRPAGDVQGAPGGGAAGPRRQAARILGAPDSRRAAGT